MAVRAPQRRPLRRSGATTSVAAVDLLVPRPPEPLVLRPRLFDDLDAGVDGPLTLVCAPAGAGKTALIASWLRERPRDVAWLGLRPRVGETAFWAEWLESLRRVVPAGSRLARLAAPRTATPTRFVVQLLNGFAELDEPVTTVVDDFHEVRARGVVGALDELLRAAPEALRLVVSTRRDPALPLHVLRAGGRLRELRAAALAFTLDETRELLAALDLELGSAELATLFERTEGWAAGLRLFTLSESGGGSRAVEALALDERPAVEYLTAEVLARQPDDVRAFLLETSIVDRLTPELADALTGRTDSAQVVERLVSDNLFVERLDGQPGRYRYHRLFAELLRAELRNTRRSDVPGLHARAAGWYADSGAPLDAVLHAFAAGDLELATDCLVETWFDLFARGDLGTRAELLGGVPETTVLASPQLAALAASLEFVAGNIRRGVRLLDAAEAAWPDSPEPQVRAVLTFARLLRRSLEGSCTKAAALARELLELAGDGHLPSATAETLRAIALGHLGLAEVFLGHYAEAQDDLDEALEAARRADAHYAELAGMAGLAWLELVNGRLRRSARTARAVVELAEARGWESSFQAGLARAALASVEHEWDELDAAAGDAAECATAARASGDRPLRAWSVCIEAALSLAQGGAAVDRGLQRLHGARAEIRTVDSPPLQRFAARLEARLLSAAGEHDAAENVVERLVARQPASSSLLAARARLRIVAGDPRGALAALDAEAGTPPAVVAVERAALGAVALRATGRHEEALASLEHALRLAEPEGIRRPLLDIGSALRDPLAEHLRSSASHRWFASELLRRLDGAGGEGPVPAELLEPLSARELEVLRYLPTMMSNADIAAELFVSVNTVKTHVKSIYRKLDAGRRQDAVRRARQLHLL